MIRLAAISLYSIVALPGFSPFNNGDMQNRTSNRPLRASGGLPWSNTIDGRTVGHQYLALEDGGKIFGVATSGIERLLRCDHAGHSNGGIEKIEGQPTRVLPVHEWIGGDRNGRPIRRHVVLLRTGGERTGIVVDRALTTFMATDSDLRILHPGAIGELVLCPVTRLGAHLAARAVPAQVLAARLLANRGTIRLVGKELWAGDYRLNGETAIVDEVVRTTGYGCTIFARNVRVATTAVVFGSHTRALGTRANAEVTALTYESGREFRGIARTLGKDWAIIYRPLYDASRVVGMLATYQEVSGLLFPILDLQRLVSRASRSVVNESTGLWRAI